jgi:hypothetical protein
MVRRDPGSPRRELETLRDRPFVGEVVDPLRGIFAYRVSLPMGLLPLELLYRVDTLGRQIDVLEVVVPNPPESSG